jgi:hypothetical protein
MPTSIAIICTINEVLPYSIADGANRYFSVNLSAALRGDPALPGDAANLLQPWLLTFGTNNLPTVQVYADNLTSGAQPAGSILPQSSVTLAAPGNIPTAQQVKPVTTRLINRFNAAVAANDTTYFHWADDPSAPTQAPGENWSRVLAHASTYTTPIPYALKLAFLLKIDKHSLNGMTRLFVAPVITDGTTLYQPGAAPDQPANNTASWEYTTAPKNFAPMSAFEPEYMLATTLPVLGNLPKPHFIDPNIYWIGTEDGTDQTEVPEAVASQDWRTTLEHRAGEALDLAQRVIVLLRNLYFPAAGTATFPTYGDMDLMRDAVVSALRDTADFGLRYGPDGSSLVRFIFQRAGVVPDAYIAILIAVKPSLNDWITFLETCGVSTQRLHDAYDSPPAGAFASRGKPSDTASAAYVKATLDLLDSIQTALATDATLATVLYQQWNTYLAGKGNWSASGGNAGDGAAVQAELNTLTAAQPDSATVRSSRILRRRMLLANMGGSVPDDSHVPIWNALVATPPNSSYGAETSAVTAHLKGLITSYFRGRFDISVPDQNSSLFGNRLPDAKWPGTTAAPNPDLTACPATPASPASCLADDAQAFADKILFPADPATAASHPVILQIGDTTDDPTVLQQNDVERRIAGVGLLVREESGPWTCANIANVYVEDSNAADGFSILLQNVLIPIRIHTRNKLKQSILEYKNYSLVVQDTDNAPSNNLAKDCTFPSKLGQDWAQMLQYRFDPGIAAVSFTTDDTQQTFTLVIPPFFAPGTAANESLENWKRLPALKFGLHYTFLPYVIDNSGVLPPLLSDPTFVNPFTPILPSAFATAWTAAKLTGYLRTIQHLRRVGVGAPRIRGAQASIQQDLPAIPAGVVPLARDFVGDTKIPVLLLYNSNSSFIPSASFTFQLRPPACDLETWDRWVAGLGENYRNTRIAVATGLSGFNAKSTSDPVPATALDLSIDDPAVNQLLFSLTQIYPPPAQPIPAPLQRAVAIPALAALGGTISGPINQISQTLLKPVQFSGVTVNCSIDNLNPPNLLPTSNGLNVTIQEGQVWRLSVAAGIGTVSKFEDPDSLSTPPSFDLYIEAATAGVFAIKPDANVFTALQQHIYQNLTICLHGKKDPDNANSSLPKDQLSATLTPWTGKDPSRDLIREVDLRLQAWRWMGRPILPLPPAAHWTVTATNPMSALDADPPADPIAPLCSRVWELGSFAERNDNDSAIYETMINFASASAGKVTLHTSDLSADPRAQYFRFGIDVHSRYEGLRGFPLATVSAMSAAASPFTRWRRGIIPPRITGTIPKPKILLVIPLTEPASDGTNTLPDLLAIANEPLFGIGGIAEKLYVELDLARDPSVPLSTPIQSANPIPEFGPNPILSSTSLDPNTTPFDGNKTGFAAPADIIGITFDLASSSAFFANTCFRLQSSMLYSAASEFLGAPSSQALEHYEAKIRFKRAVDGSNFGVNANQPLVSDLTDPFWVEFQSSFKHCSTVEKGLVPISSLQYSIANNTLSFTSDGVPVTLQAGPPASPGVLELWALAMRQIHDATGAIQAAPIDFLGPAFSVANTEVTDSADVVIYLIEVLRSPEFTGSFDSGIAKAEALLFPSGSSLTNAMVRFERCSSAIGNKAAAS